MSSLARSCRVAVAALALTSFARAQCLDWVPGFGIPGNGLGASVCTLLGWDDGTGATVYAAGQFFELADGTPAGVIRWNGTGWTPLGGRFNNEIDALAAFDDGSGEALYACGRFTETEGQSARSLVRWDGAAWQEVGNVAALTQLRCMLVYDDGTGEALYVGGNFVSIGGVPAARIARWDGTSWSALGGGLADVPFDLEVYDDGSGPAIYAAGGGVFNDGVNPGRCVSKWDGTSWSSIPGGCGGADFVNAMAVYDDGGGEKLYFTGCFDTEVEFIKNIASWDGTTWATVGGRLNSDGHSLHVHTDALGTRLYVGGDFSTAAGVFVNRIAAWDGTSWSPLGQGITFSSSHRIVVAMASDTGGSEPILFAGGELLEAGGKPSEHVAAWGVPCSAPLILSQPSSQTAVFPEAVTFKVEATGTADVTYQWRHNGVPLVDDKVIFGSQTDELTLFRWSYSNRGQYDCVIVNPFGSVTTDLVTLEIPVPPIGVPIPVETVFYPPVPMPDMSGREFDDSCCSVQAWDERVLTRADIESGGPTLLLIGDGSSELLLESNTPAPVFGDPMVLVDTSTPFSTWSLANQGQTVISGQLRTGFGGVDTPNNQLIWFRDDLGWEIVVREGDAVPDLPSGTWWQTKGPRINNSGVVAFWAQVSDNGSIVESSSWRWSRANGLENIARTGDAAPGTPDVFTFIKDTPPLLDSSGRVLIVGRTDQDQDGLWFGDPSGLTLVVKEGDPAPGMGAGAVFDNVEFGETLSDNGIVYFAATVEVPGGTILPVLYRWESGTLTLIAARGGSAPVPGPIAYTYSSLKPMNISPSGTCVFESQITYSCGGGTCSTKALFYEDGTGPVVIVTGDPDPLPGFPRDWTLTGYGRVVLNDLGHVVFEAFGNAGALLGWTAKQGLFPIAAGGQQVEINPGEYQTIAGFSLSGVDGSGSNGSRNLTPGGGILYDVTFWDDDFTSGIFRGLFSTIAASYAPCAAIVRQPASTSVPLGGTASFNVIAGGEAPLSYQWFLNGFALSDDGRITGATSSELTIDSVVAADAGVYTVLVSNGCGSETSSGASLNSGFGASFCDASDGALASCPCGNTGSAGTGCDIQQGTGGVSMTTILQQTGAENRVTAQGEGFPPASTPAAIVLRATSLEATPVVFGDGLRCVGVPVVRLAATFASGGVSTHTFGHGTMVGAGDFYYQLWFRNSPAMFCTPNAFNMSNGRVLSW